MSFRIENLSIPFINNPLSEIWNSTHDFRLGEYTHIKASSGKGKSTLMASLYGLHHAYNGTIFYKGKRLKDMNIDSICQFRMNLCSVVFQDLKLFTSNTAFENVELKRQQSNYYAKEEILRMARCLGIEEVLHRSVSTLSFGERQRAAILRALIQPFEMLLLDEPFSHLDTKNISNAVNLIHQEVEKRNAGLIILDLESDKHFSYHKHFNL